MKRLVFLILFSLIIGSMSFALESGDLHSNEALLVDLSGDVVLFHKDTNKEPVPMASLTKLMTYLLTVENIEDLENTKITASGDIIKRINALNASVAGIEEGYEYTIVDLLYGLLLPSGCDVAETLGTYIGSGDTEVFVQMMNEKAQELGMTDTTYIDSHGIGTPTEDNYSSEQDIYVLFKCLLDKPYFREIISTPVYSFKGEKSGDEIVKEIKNTNYLISKELKEGKYYYPNAVGGKSGSLNVAGRCLVNLGEKDGREVVVVTLGVPGESSSTYDYHLKDNITLLKYAFGEWKDIISSEWAKEELKRARELGLISEQLIEKDFRNNINREEFAELVIKLYEKMTGEKIKVEENPFVDTDNEYVIKAYSKGITLGKTDDTFSPYEEITREQIATMLLRTLEKAGVDVRINLDMIKEFDDNEEMHEWSRPAIYYMAVKDIIKGTGNNMFDVKGNAKIEEAVVVALRCLKQKI